MIDREEMVGRAADLVPVLRDRASQAEKLRRLPAETVNELRDSGLLRVSQPKRFGGLDLDFDVTFDVASELGRGCGSTAWCYSIWANHNWIMGLFPAQAQEEYWADSHDTLSSTSFDPSRANATPEGQNYRLSGRWSFSSGCDEASWAILGGLGPTGALNFLIPRSDFVIEDNWHVSGLRGTGSKDIVVEDVYVPEHRVVLMEDLQEARSPGRTLYDTPNTRVPLFSVFTWSLASPIVGMAQGVVDAFEDLMGKRLGRTGEKMAEWGGIQSRLAESSAEVDAARLVMQHDSRQVFTHAHRGEQPPMEERIRYRRDQVYVTKLCIQSVNRLFEVSGGHALYDSSPIQRLHRDAHAASHHIGLFWDAAAEQYGQHRLGMEMKGFRG